MEEQSLKDQAQDIIVAVDHDLKEVESKELAVQDEVATKANAIMDSIFRIVSDVDFKAAVTRVEELKKEYPEDSIDKLSKRLIRDKCQHTGTVGAVTSGAGLIPGIGTAAAMTLGVAADIGATFKLQAELVLEVAALYDYPLTEDEKQRLVMMITGLSAGTTALARKAGERAVIKVTEKFAEKSVLKAIPVVGILASAGTNVLSTYIIGQRADAYFRLGPDAMGSLSDSLRAITGVDERNIATWLAESGKTAGEVIASGAGKVSEAGKVAGATIVSSASKTAEAVGSGAKKAGNTAQRGIKAYILWWIGLWTIMFGYMRKFLGFIWFIISFIPRWVMDWFRQRKQLSTENIQEQSDDSSE